MTDAEAPHSPPGRLLGLFLGVRSRIMAGIVILLAFSTLLSVLAIRELLLANTADRVDAALTQEVEEFRALMRGRNPSSGRLDRIFDAYFSRNVPGEGETLIAYLDGRQYLAKSGGRGGAIAPESRPPRWATLRSAERGDVGTPAGTVRYVAVPVLGADDSQGVFVVASALSNERKEVEDAVRLAALVLVVVLLVASALAWVVAGHVLAPLRGLSETARSIGETDLTRRIAVSGRDEIAELSRTFNEMLDRVEQAFGTQRAFVSDASHELRTPIAIVRGNIELLGGEDDPAEREETIALVTGELDRMSRFVDDLLLLAKAERRDFLRLADVELGALTDELLEKAAALGRRDWKLDSRGEAVLVADRQRLTQAIVGLAQNAVQHTGEGDQIWLGSTVERGEARLWVRDSGPGVPAGDHERIFERFARAGASPRRAEGAGLGLAIVRAIAEAHGGRVALSSRPGAGAKFTVILPLDGHGEDKTQQ